VLPHPRAHERAFVLAPWHDVEPDAELPDHGPVGDLLAKTVDQAVTLRQDLQLTAQ
jgi:2-amino-4-hydroxy-6-hydroxymethyldihydropteridine diphosphokinase